MFYLNVYVVEVQCMSLRKLSPSGFQVSLHIKWAKEDELNILLTKLLYTFYSFLQIFIDHLLHVGQHSIQ
jgi:hypothetical protein